MGRVLVIEDIHDELHEFMGILLFFCIEHGREGGHSQQAPRRLNRMCLGIIPV
jgi:hypothetical protein